MNQQFHFWVYIWRKQKPYFKKVYAPQCWQQHYLQLQRYGSNLGVHQHEWTNSVLVTRLCPTLCDPMDCSPPGFSVCVLQARILEWVASSFSNTHTHTHTHTQTVDCSVQFSSVAQLCPTLCDSVNCSTPGLPVHHQLPEFTQTHVHWAGDAIQPSHPLLSPSPPTPNPSQH